MITNAFLIFVFTIVNGLVGLLPGVTASSGFSAGIHTAAEYMSGINVIVPVDTLLTILFFLVAFEAAYLLFKVIYWVIRRLPTQS